MLAALKRLPPAAFVAWGLLLAYLVALFWRGTGSTIEIVDNLDIGVPLYSTLTLKQLFGPGSALIPNIMGGTIPRWAITSPVRLDAILQVGLGAFPGIVIFETLTRALGLAFMQRLLQREVKIKDPVITWGVALCLALMPINISTIGVLMLLPMVACAFLALMRAESKAWLAALAVYPLFGGIQLGFPAFIMCIGLLLRAKLSGTGGIRRGALVLLGFIAFYLMVDYELVMQIVFGSGFVSQRSERVWPSEDMEYITFNLVMTLFKVGPEFHARAIAFPIITPLLMIAALVPLIPSFRSRNPGWLFYALSGLFLVMAVVYSFWFYEPVLALQQKLHITDFYFRRFIYLTPLMIYVAWAIAMVRLIKWRWLHLLLIGGQLALLGHESQAAARMRDPDAMSFDQYFSPRLFAKIRDAIGAPQNSYRVVSLGLSVNVPLYNGFYTLDGYLPNYPLENKHKFRSVIAPELTRELIDSTPDRERVKEHMRDLFDKWGNSLQIYTTELLFYWQSTVDGMGAKQKRTRTTGPITFKMDFAGFYPDGVRYFFSAVPVEVAPYNHLKLFGVFEDETSPYRIFVYQVLPKEASDATAPD